MCHPRERLVAALVAVLAGVVVFLIASELFPYHSSNHDEGVYLQQAELLLDGQLRLHPGGYGEAVRPWFFVDAGDHFYPKYQPLPAGLYAVSMALFGEPRVTLAAIAAGNTALVYVLGAMAFDRRVGVVAAALFAGAPMTLITSSVFLPYAPTTLFNLSFAVAYLHSYRTGRRASALLAGGAIGVAFFMRPFTAVLFAAPFVAHACWEVLTTIRGGLAVTALRERLADSKISGFRSIPPAVQRQALTAVAGVAFVALALAYNASLTGSPLTFPYAAFAPQDGPGFGRRRILSHSIEYTPRVAIRSNTYVLWYLLTRWGPAGALGTLLAVGGVFASVTQRGVVPIARWLGTDRPTLLSGDGTAQSLLLGLFVTVPLGNLFFWGNYNVLARPSDPTDGLLGQFGPFYHFDLLAPLAVFAAAGLLACWRGRGWVLARARGTVPMPGQATRRALGVAVLLVGVLVVGGTSAALLTGPVDRNAAHTETYEDAYAPFEQQEFDDAVVFLPTPYGDWLNHPFQHLRNDADLDGETVYALDRDPESNFAVVDAAANRSYYRYTFHGEWTANPEERVVVPRVERLSVREGQRLDGDTVVGVPGRVDHAVVRLETSNGYTTSAVSDPGDQVGVEWSLNDSAVALDTVDGSAVENGTVGIDDTEEVVLTVRLAQPSAGTLTYRQEASVRTTDGGVEVIWPPERTVCPLVDNCGYEGTYLPEHPEQHFDGVQFETYLLPATETVD